MKEFVCVWFEKAQQWIVLAEDGTALQGYPAIGYAVNAALKEFGGAEADWDCVEDTGEFYRYILARG